QVSNSGVGSARRVFLCRLLGRRRLLLLGRLLGGHPLLGRLLDRALLTTLLEQLGGPLEGDVVDGVVLAERSVGRAVGDVGTESALLDDDALAAGRVRTQFPEGRGRGPLAPA